MILFKELMTVNYAVRILVWQFHEITRKDDIAIASFENEKTLGDLLDDLPYVESVDYNGHFGANIYIELEAESDNRKNWNEIKNIIADYIEKETENDDS